MSTYGVAATTAAVVTVLAHFCSEQQPEQQSNEEGDGTFVLRLKHGLAPDIVLPLEPDKVEIALGPTPPQQARFN